MRDDPHAPPHKYEVGDEFVTGLVTWRWEIEKLLLDAADDSPYYHLRGVGEDNAGKTKLIAEHSLQQHFEEVC